MAETEGGGAIGRASGSGGFAAGPEGIFDVAVSIAEARVEVPAEVTVAARLVAPAITQVKLETVRAALERILVAPGLGEGLQWLHDAGVLRLVLPEIDATVDFSQEAGRRHKDVWEHTKQVIRQCSGDRVVRWSALLHDIGKVPTRRLLPDGRVTFHRHAEVGARMFDAIARRLQFERTDFKEVRFLILNHLRANAYEASWTDAAVRRFDKEMGARLGRLVDLSLADVTSRRPGRRDQVARNIEDLMRRIEQIRQLDAEVPPLPPGLGNAIMEALRLPPSRRIGELRKLCEDAINRGEIDAHQDVPYYLEYLLKQELPETRRAAESPSNT